MKFYGRKAKGIVWEHNTHVGDARFTNMKDDGMWNVGQLVREKYQKNSGVFIVGFSSYEGSVIAGRMWDGPMQSMNVPPAVKDSIEYILHNDSPENKLILLNSDYWRDRFHDYKGHRAIGVVYHPEHDRRNYVPTRLASRYDAIVHIDFSNALHPIHLQPHGFQMPETYPFGF